MKKATNITIRTYELGDGFMVDVVTTEHTYDAYIYEVNYGIKSLMFGCPKEQQTYREFLRMVEANAPEYIESYDEEFMD